MIIHGFAKMYQISCFHEQKQKANDQSSEFSAREYHLWNIIVKKRHLKV